MNVGSLYLVQDRICLKVFLPEVIIAEEGLPQGLQMGGVLLLLVIIGQFPHLPEAFGLGLDIGGELHSLEGAQLFFVKLVFVYFIEVGQYAVCFSGIIMCLCLFHPFGILMAGRGASGDEQKKEGEEKVFHYYTK